MLTGSRLEYLFKYHPDTGVFTQASPSKRKLSGRVRGHHRPDGYLSLRIDGRSYLAHRLAWLWMTGEWPKEEIDHINRNRADNRFSNLRPATRSENTRNNPVRKNSTSKVLGVSFRKDKNCWRAYITVDRKQITLGHYKAKEEAVEARKQAEIQYFGDFAPT